MSRYAAVDLGAESGRVIVGTLADSRIVLDDIYRFTNTPVRTPDGLHWDVLRLFHEVLTGLQAATQQVKGTEPLAGIGVDSWAVDFGLLDAGGRLLGNPYHYRDARTDGVRDEVARHISPTAQYSRTGIAQLPFNTLYQLRAAHLTGDPSLEAATALLMIPDLLHYWLCGTRTTEYTNASTSGLLGVDGAWALDWLGRLDLPGRILLTPTQHGTALGTLRPSLREEWGLGPIPVVAPATHDTACAVVAMPVEPGESTAGHLYISSGTWSLLGVELDHPVLSEQARNAGFTNEGGAGGTYRLLTNIMGLWLLQECRRAWARSGHNWSYEELTAAAGATASTGAVLDVDNAVFLHPADMPAALAAQLARTGQQPTDAPAALARIILESLALAYRGAMEIVEGLTGTRIHVIHVLGGGSRNSMLCQLTADACGRPVLAGPVEATALGNVLTQAMGRGEVPNLAAAHALARASATIDVYEPAAGGQWEEMYARLRGIQRQHIT